MAHKMRSDIWLGSDGHPLVIAEDRLEASFLFNLRANGTTVSSDWSQADELLYRDREPDLLDALQARKLWRFA
jgi:hypothetical protein